MENHRERGNSFGHSGEHVNIEEMTVMKLMEEIMEID